MRGVGHCLLLLSLVGRRDQILESLDESLDCSTNKSVSPHPPERAEHGVTHSLLVSAPADYHYVPFVDSDFEVEATNQAKTQCLSAHVWPSRH